MRNQLFIISKAAREALDLDELEATIEGLKEMGLYALPYPRVDVWIAADDFAGTTYDDLELYEDGGKTVQEYVAEGRMYLKTEPDGRVLAMSKFGPGSWIELTNLSLDDTNYQKYLTFQGCKGIKNQRLLCGQSYEKPPRERELIINGLIGLLATRNTVKTVEHNKLARLGIGCKKGGTKAYEYVTTISVPSENELSNAQDEGTPTGATKAAHWRRGHIRHQHFGPGNEFVKLVWIAPVFVNADKNWIATTRRAYNLGAP